MNKMQSKYIPMTETMFYILLSLQEERYGYGIMKHVETLTSGRIVLGAGTIYQSLGKLQKDGLIQPVKEIERKKIYKATTLGRKILVVEAKRIAEIYKNSEGLR